MSILHACWLIDPWRESRTQYLKMWVKKGFDVVVWHDGQLASPPAPGVELRSARGLVEASPIAEAFAYEKGFRVHAACADLFRYEVLLQEGGTYADLDVRPLRPLQELGREPRFEEDDRRHLEIRYLASPPGHELLRELRDESVRQEASFVSRGGYKTLDDLRGVLDRTGPQMAARVARAWAARNYVPYKRLLLPKAIDANTRENRREHYSRRWRDVCARLNQPKDAPC